MSAVVEAVVPLFTVVLLGWLAGRRGVLDQAGIRGLVAFVFNFGLPPLLFRLMATTDVTAIGEWGFLGTYLAVQALMFVVGGLGGRVLFGMTFAEMTIQGFGCAFANSVLLGLPLLLWLFGEAGAVPALLIITMDVMVFSIVTFLLEIGRGGSAAGIHRLAWKTLRAVLLNPIIMATAFGILYGLAGLGLPRVVDQTLGFLGQAAAPAALFALGASLSQRHIAGRLGAAGFMVVVKLFVHPALFWLALAGLPDLDPLWRQAGVIITAGPVGLNVFLFAQHYDAGIETASSAILISTGLAVLTITGLLLLLPPLPV